MGTPFNLNRSSDQHPPDPLFFRIPRFKHILAHASKSIALLLLDDLRLNPSSPPSGSLEVLPGGGCSLPTSIRLFVRLLAQSGKLVD